MVILVQGKHTSFQPSNKPFNMSLITQQTLLQARSDRDDALHRMSVGEDTPRVKQLLASANKRIATLEKQMATENAAAKQRAADTAAKTAHDAAKKNNRNGGQRNDRAPRGDRPPLPEDMELSCCDCSNPFTFSGKDQLFFTKNNYSAPVRCPDCRELKKNAKPSGTDLACSDCDNTFFFSDAKARVFEENAWETPKRCSDCTHKHKNIKPILINCEGCHHDFTFSVGAQKHFKTNNWNNPKRCTDCRAKKDAASVKSGSVKSAPKV